MENETIKKVKGDQQTLEAVDKFFRSGGERIDDITLASCYQRGLTDLFIGLTHSDPDKARDLASTVESLAELLKDLSDAYQQRKYSDEEK